MPSTPTRSVTRRSARIDDGVAAVGQGADVLDVGDDADAGEAVVDPGHEHEGAGVAGGLDRGAGLVALEADGDHHAGEHDAGGQGQDREGCGWWCRPWWRLRSSKRIT